MKRMAWALVLVSTGVVAAQQPATLPQAKTANAKATQDGVGAGKETQGHATVQTVSARTTTPAKEGFKDANAVKQQAAQPVPLHQHPTLVTMLHHSNGIRGRVGLRGHRLNPAL